MTFIDRLKNVSAHIDQSIQSKLSPHTEIIQKILESEFNSEFIQNRKLFIPGDVIREKIEESLAHQPGLRLKNIEFREDSIFLIASYPVVKMPVDIVATFRITSSSITKSNQKIVISVLEQAFIPEIHITDFLLKMANSTIDRVLRTGLGANFLLPENITYNQSTREYTCDLSGLAVIRQLLAPRILNRCVLDFISLDIAHQAGGLLIQAVSTDLANDISRGVVGTIRKGVDLLGSMKKCNKELKD
ncbi:MAG: hypothetical protein AB7S77_00950 [Desulfatirhabdiaceae bacterium]